MFPIENNGAPHFSTAMINTLASDFLISDLEKPDLEFMLDQGARMYFQAKDNAARNVKPADNRAILEKLERRAAALRETLAELPREIVDRFDQITINDSMKVLQKGRRSLHDQPTLTLESIDAEPGESVLLIQVSDLVQYLEAIGRLSVETKEMLPSGKMGRPTDQALDIWIANLAFFWTKHLERKFTRDEMAGGIPISQAAAFCSCASEFLDPDIAGTAVMKSMRNYIISIK